jgi:RNAse (barnase) inhibitor barstar
MNVDLPQAPEDLSDALPRADACGVFRLDPGRIEALEQALDATGLARITIDLAAVGDKASLMQAFASACAIPEWFGSNWDALADALGDLAWLPLDEGWVLVLDGADTHRDACPRDHATLLEVLQDACATWREYEVPFWVFWVPAARQAPG